MRVPKPVRISSFALFVLVAIAAGCGKSDLGATCDLVRPVCVANCDAPDPASWEVENQRYSAPDPLFDYVATGGTDCENFTCVDSAGGGDEGAYCSRRCIEDAQCQDGVDDSLVCRQLVLDDEFINTLQDGFELRCEANCDVECPEGCTDACIGTCAERRMDAIFGDIRTARFCARPAE